jgi:hypothetical protein
MALAAPKRNDSAQGRFGRITGVMAIFRQVRGETPDPALLENA